MIVPTNADYTTMNNLLVRTPIYRATIRQGPPDIQPYFTHHWPLDEPSNQARMPSYPVGAIEGLTNHGSVGATAGKHGNCATFDGSSQWFHVSAAFLDVYDSGWMIRFWVYLNSKSSVQTLAGQWGTTNQRKWRVQYRNDLDRFIFQITNGAGLTATLAADNFGAISTGTWYEVRAWRLKTGMIYIQVNSESLVTAPNVMDASEINTSFSYPTLTLGADNESGNVNVGTNLLNGRIDEVTFSVTNLLQDLELAILYDRGSGSSLPIPADKYVTYGFDTAHDADGNLQAHLTALVPLALERQLDMPYSRFPLSTFTFRLNNLTGAEALFVAGCAGAECILDGSFWELAFGTYARFFTGYITEVRAEEGSFLLTAQSKLSVALQSILFAGAKTQLSNSINSALTTIPVVDESGFTDDFGYLVIDQEIITYQNTMPKLILNLGRRPVYPFIIPPLIDNGQASAHNLGAEVRELVYLGFRNYSNSVEGIAAGGSNDLHPCDHIRTVLTGVTVTGAIVSDKQCVGITNRLLLNETEMAALRTLIGPDVQFLFLDDEPTTAKDFLEKELYLPCAMYPTEDAQGRIGGRLYPTESDWVSVDSITDEHALEVPQWDRQAEVHINQVHYYYDYNPVTRSYATLRKFVDDALVAQHGRELPLSIYSKGIRSPYNGTSFDEPYSWFLATDAFLLAAATRHLSRFGSRAPVLRVETILRNNLLECSDDVAGIFTNIPDEVNAAQNINRPFRVVGSNIDFQSNTVVLELMEHTAFQSTVRQVTTLTVTP